MPYLRQILSEKGKNVFTAPPSMSVFEAIGSMAERNVGALLIIENDELVGIFSERDYLRKIALKFRSSRKTQLSEVMSSPVLCANLDDEVNHCMGLMTKHHYRHLPVLEDGELCGIVSIGDLVGFLLREKEVELDQLNQYIAGGY
ncbi:MAG: CBS domain-containing protein [Xanthomonadales bacterium]|nr:CBS domain-containing protein [Xanthomonadales bacterium]